MKRNKLPQTILTILTLTGFAALLWGGVQSGLADETTLSITANAKASIGTNGLCPGGYIGYVKYTKTMAEGWGWAPTNTIHTVTDTNRSDTKVEFDGMFADTGCNQTTVSVPNPCPSPKYQFTVFFTSNVPTNPYTIELKGFSP